MEINNLNDDELKGLAEKLRPYLMTQLGVTVKRMHRVQSGKIVAYVDLAFTAGNEEICIVHGFKLLRNQEDDSMWLAVPQRRDERETGVKWLDTFEFGGSKLEKLARRVVVDEFKRLEQQEVSRF